MELEELFLREVELDDDFNYKALYNDGTRGARYKDEHKHIIREALKKGTISVKKFIVDENVQDELFEIVNNSRGAQITLIENLKEYYDESSFVIAPLIYILRLIDPNYSIYAEERLQIQSKIAEFNIKPRIDGANAMPRIYMPKDNIALTTTNDSVDNLSDILTTKDVEVFIIGTCDRSNNILAYKVIRNDNFYDEAKDYLEKIKNKNRDLVHKYSI